MNRIGLSVLVVLLLAACSPEPPADTGIEGRVTVGPMCPVMQPGQECPDQPLQATLSVLAPDGRRVTRFTAQADGSFRVPLRPGTYILHPEPQGGASWPSAPEQTFTVTEGSFTHIDVVFDSGIR